LIHGFTKEFVEEWWNAEKYVPDGIVAGSTLWDLVNQPVEKAEVMYPYSGINGLTYGIRQGELVTVTAGSGLGKSQFLREIVWQILSKTEDNIGLMFLEESVKKTAKSLMSLAANKPLHLPDCDIDRRSYAMPLMLPLELIVYFCLIILGLPPLTILSTEYALWQKVLIVAMYSLITYRLWLVLRRMVTKGKH